MLVGEPAALDVEPLALRSVVGVRDRRPQHPIADLLAVDFRLELGLQPRDLLAVLAGEVAEVALAREPPELADAAVAVGRGGERLGPFEPRELLVALVDRLELERLLQAREMLVVLLVELGDEPVGLRAIVIEFVGCRRVLRHRP